MTTLREAAQQALEFAADIVRGKYKGNAEEMRDALRAALAQQAPHHRPHPDTIRLAYLYGGEKTASDALMNAQLRLLLGGTLTLDEARAAIDDAIANPMKEAGE
jgi:hypothetical protein